VIDGITETMNYWLKCRWARKQQHTKLSLPFKLDSFKLLQLPTNAKEFEKNSLFNLSVSI